MAKTKQKAPQPAAPKAPDKLYERTAQDEVRLAGYRDRVKAQPRPGPAKVTIKKTGHMKCEVADDYPDPVMGALARLESFATTSPLSLTGF